MPDKYAIVDNKYPFPNKVRYLDKWFCVVCVEGGRRGTFGQHTKCHFCHDDTRTSSQISKQLDACERYHTDQHSKQHQQGRQGRTGRRKDSSRERAEQRRRRPGGDGSRPREDAAAAADQKLKSRVEALERELDQAKRNQPRAEARRPGSYADAARSANQSTNHGNPPTTHPPDAPQSYRIDVDDEDEEGEEQRHKSTAECQAELDDLAAELKFVQDGLKNMPKAKNLLELQEKVRAQEEQVHVRAVGGEVQQAQAVGKAPQG